MGLRKQTPHSTIDPHNFRLPLFVRKSAHGKGEFVKLGFLGSEFGITLFAVAADESIGRHKSHFVEQ